MTRGNLKHEVEEDLDHGTVAYLDHGAMAETSHGTLDERVYFGAVDETMDDQGGHGGASSNGVHQGGDGKEEDLLSRANDPGPWWNKDLDRPATHDIGQK